MELDVFDTYVTQSNGKLMHFDVFLPKGSSRTLAEKYALEWLESVQIKTDSINLEKCRFCHTESASPEYEQAVKSQGYAILQMEGCPSPIY